MNKCLLSMLLVYSFTAFTGQSKIQELQIEKLFVIENGFDSNDDVEITLQMKLPNACYKVHDAKIQKIDAHSYELRAFAKKKDLSGCEVGHYNTPINVTQTLYLGELPPGEYKFHFNAKDSEQMEKIMIIKAAHEQTIDDDLYAPISNAFIPELIYPTESGIVVLTGIFHNNCFFLNQENIKIIRENNIFIIIPQAQYLNRDKCKNEFVPIRQVVDLGPIENPGSYLIHVRSMSGLAVNKVFFVNPKPQLNRGNLEP